MCRDCPTVTEIISIVDDLNYNHIPESSYDQGFTFSYVHHCGGSYIKYCDLLIWSGVDDRREDEFSLEGEYLGREDLKQHLINYVNKYAKLK